MQHIYVYIYYAWDARAESPGQIPEMLGLAAKCLKVSRALR